MAVEPYVRRLWPHTLITWTRLINGQLRDPLVGRHVLVGALAGLGMTGVFLLPNLILPLTGRGIPDPHIHTFDGLASSRVLAAQFLDVLRISFFIPVSLLLVVMLLRSVFRSPAVAYTVLFAVLGGFLLLIPGSWVDTIGTLGTVALATVILSRLGLVALVVCIVFSSWPFFYLTTDASSWYFPSSVATMMVFAAAAMYAFRVSLGGQKVFTDAILDPSPATK